MRQARTRSGVCVCVCVVCVWCVFVCGCVKRPSGKQLFDHSSHFQVLIILSCLMFVVFYACPQLMNDVDCNLSGVCAFGNAEIKKECSSDYSNCIKNEGNIVVHFFSLFHHVNVR